MITSRMPGHKVVWLLFLLSAAQAQIQPAIPLMSEDPGIRYDDGGSQSQVLIEAFLECLCSDSAYSWLILKDVVDHYGTDVALVVQQTPLPYHRHGFLATQGYYLIYDALPNQTFNYLEAVFRNIPFFSAELTSNKTKNEVISELADVAAEATGIDPEYFVDNIGNYDGYTREAWKYAVRRGVGGTPWFFVNGIDLSVYPGNPHIEFDDWLEILDPLLDDDRKEKEMKTEDKR